VCIVCVHSTFIVENRGRICFFKWKEIRLNLMGDDRLLSVRLLGENKDSPKWSADFPHAKQKKKEMGSGGYGIFCHSPAGRD
jgi:hypothetical protein